MKRELLTKTLLSFTASTLVLQADIAPISAHLDLETYSRIIVDFNTSTSGTGFDTAGESNFTIENNTTDDNLTLAFVATLDDYSTIYEIAGGTEGGTGNDLNATEAVKKIRGNTQNGLQLLWDNNTSNDLTDDTNLSLLTTIGTLDVTDDAWNLVTMPAGVYTNAKELIKANKVTMVWGWSYDGSAYNWASYPDRMEPAKGYWVRTRVSGNTGGTLGNIVASDYNLTLKSDDSNINDDINASNFVDVVSKIPLKEEWVLLGNSGDDVNITSTVTGNENNSSIYFFEDLLNSTHNCYFVSIYHWDAANNLWINDTEGGATPDGQTIPANAGIWVKQRLCDN